MNKIIARTILFIGLTFLLQNFVNAQTFSFTNNAKGVSILYGFTESKLDSIAAHLLAKDIKLVTGIAPILVTDHAKVKGNVIMIGNITSPLIQKFIGTQSTVFKGLKNKWECFGYKVVDNPTKNIAKAFVIAGSDARGTAYGVFTLSEKIGVSPWYWWADVAVKQQKNLTITQQDYVSNSPGVKYRGIFINDEDWGLQPWAAKTFEPETGDIGPKTYAKVFELLLRLKANLIWPAMHPSTKAFFHYPGNVKTAEDYQIIIGSSHAEPMLRNNVGEWNEKTMGHFNYITNKDSVYKYWEDRVKESKGINAIYSMGMRGVHDGQMEGVKDLKDAVPLLENIMQDERGLLTKYINKNITSVPQALTVYKEVLDIYDYGLKVPDDITLVWPDDNYGYIQRLNNESEQARAGGAGVYYHASYWGRPHDYLWLPSANPSIMTEEMMKAYETGARRLWVVNVGDIKPQEYNMQQFLDIAYNPTPFKDSRYTKQHLLQWVNTQFGKELGEKIQPILSSYFQLALERRPEFMGWSQTEPTTKTNYTTFNHFYFGDEAQKRIDKYDALEREVKKLRNLISSQNADAFYQLVYYPVVGASWMNKKFLYRDKSYLYGKQNRLSALDYAAYSKAVYDSIAKETTYYNTMMAGGKWNLIMSMKPRELPVYQEPIISDIKIDSTESWSIAPEGYVTKDSSLLTSNATLSLPPFDNLHKQKFFVDIFLSKNETIQWTSKVSNNWIRLSKTNGSLNAMPNNNQERIWVDVDWTKMTKNEKSPGIVTFAAGGNSVDLHIQVNNINASQLFTYKGFVERNGHIAINAAHFSRQANKSDITWSVVDGLGYTGKSVQASPIIVNDKPTVNKDSIKKFQSYVEYDFYTLTPIKPIAHIFALPTHPINNSFKVRYALSVDDGPLQIADIKTFGRSEEWKQNVLKNRAERKIQMPYLAAGKHTLKIYTIDPGVVIDEIRIDLGGLKTAYSSLPETVKFNN